jgi:shikimate dehydrogenase
MHTAALEAHGLSGSYSAMQVDEAGFADATEDIRSGRLHGVNVTMPHKLLAYQASDRTSAEAAFGQSVNSLKMIDGCLVGITTDVPAIRGCWMTAGIPTKNVLVLGAGGAAAAALVALAPVAGTLAVAARRSEAALDLVDRVGFSVGIHSWEEPFDGSIVNATPIGMKGEQLPEQFGSSAALFDMAYGAGTTPAVADCGIRQVPFVGGIDMLVEQAALSFEWWTGMSAPRAEMMAAAIS